MTETTQNAWNPNEPFMRGNSPYAVRFEISLATVQQMLRKNSIPETTNNISVLKACISNVLNAMDIETLIQNQIDACIKSGELQTEVKDIQSRINGITEKLRGQIDYLQHTVDQPANKDIKSEMQQSLYTAKLSLRQWERLLCAPVDSNGCLQKDLDALPKGISLSNAYDIYLKTYKTEV